MPKRQLIRVCDDPPEEDSATFLVPMIDAPFYHVVEDQSPPTIEELADYCDQDAENNNLHDFVGVHRVLALMIAKKVGKEKATEIIREIAEYDGIQGFAFTDAYTDYGLRHGFDDDWSVPDAN